MSQFPESGSDTLTRSVRCLTDGGVLLYPTDTIYGLGCDINFGKAIDKISAIKGRDSEKPFIVLAGSPDYVKKAFEIPDYLDLNLLWPGPFSILLKPQADTPNPFPGLKKIAVRVADDPFLKNLFGMWQGLLISTSANPSGAPYNHNWPELVELFESQVDLMVERIPYPLSPPSALLDPKSGGIRVLRAGPRPVPPEIPIIEE